MKILTDAEAIMHSLTFNYSKATSTVMNLIYNYDTNWYISQGLSSPRAGSFVPRTICSLGLMFHKAYPPILFNKAYSARRGQPYVPRVLCSPRPMFPRVYVSRVLCSYGPM